jgi:hypothetical protein
MFLLFLNNLFDTNKNNCYYFEITFLGYSRIHSRRLQAEADLKYVDQQHSDGETPGSHLHENGIAF